MSPNPRVPPDLPNNLAAAQQWAARQLTTAGIATAALDARVLVQHALRLSPGALIIAPDRPLSNLERQTVAAIIERRAAREPTAYILGQREFWSLDFQVGPAVLIPRPDSETLIEAALDVLPVDRPARILDLGTGSGCLLCAVLSERPTATGIGIDLSPAAAAVAAANAHRLGLGPRASFVVSDWAAALSGRFDLVLCNPPYIPTTDFASLMPEVAGHEPRLALNGGDGGLAAYTRLCPDLLRLLIPGGAVAFEVGVGQASAVSRLCAAAGLIPAPTRADLAGVARCLVATAPNDIKKTLGHGEISE